MCKISVVMSVYNCEKFVGETIQSVLNQTVTDWEFIIIDDCSKDKSPEIIKSFNDSRIKYIRNEVNKGQCENLNYGISIAKGEYIARLDHDDICYPQRFDKQLEFMNKHKDVVLCGAKMDIWRAGVIYKAKVLPIIGQQEVRFSLMFEDFCTPHSSFFIRKNVLIDNNILYDKKYTYAEDYDLLIRLLQVGNIDYIPESLIIYRVFPEQVTMTCGANIMWAEKDEIRLKYLQNVKLDNKTFLKKAILRKLISKEDFYGFENEYIELAEKCGINVQKVNISEDNVLKYTYSKISEQQKNSITHYLMYMNSQFSKRSFLITFEGVKFLIKSLLHYNKKGIYGGEND